MVAFGYFLDKLTKDDIILTTFQEHASLILPAFELAKRTGAIIKYIPLLEDGKVDMIGYKNLFKEHNLIKAVFVSHISNVFGYINPIKEMCKIAHENNVLVNVDGTQSVPHIKVDVIDLDCDFLSFSSHKMLGPSGVGVLYGKKNLLEKFTPMRLGGGANSRFNKECEVVYKPVPTNFEAGTPPIEQVLALASAIEYLDKIGFENIANHEKILAKRIIQGLKEMDNVTLYNENSDTGIIVFSFKGIFSQDASSYLSSHNICVRGGNHCSKLTDNVLGTNDTLRISLYVYNTMEEVEKFLEIAKTVTIEKCIDVMF